MSPSGKDLNQGYLNYVEPDTTSSTSEIVEMLDEVPGLERVRLTLIAHPPPGPFSYVPRLSLCSRSPSLPLSLSCLPDSLLMLDGFSQDPVPSAPTCFFFSLPRKFVWLQFLRPVCSGVVGGAGPYCVQ